MVDVIKRRQEGSFEMLVKLLLAKRPTSRRAQDLGWQSWAKLLDVWSTFLTWQIVSQPLFDILFDLVEMWGRKWWLSLKVAMADMREKGLLHTLMTPTSSSSYLLGSTLYRAGQTWPPPVAIQLSPTDHRTRLVRQLAKFSIIDFCWTNRWLLDRPKLPTSSGFEYLSSHCLVLIKWVTCGFFLARPPLLTRRNICPSAPKLKREIYINLKSWWYTRIKDNPSGMAKPIKWLPAGCNNSEWSWPNAGSSSNL